MFFGVMGSGSDASVTNVPSRFGAAKLRSCHGCHNHTRRANHTVERILHPRPVVMRRRWAAPLKPARLRAMHQGRPTVALASNS
jgi:hypothetical protein